MNTNCKNYCDFEIDLEKVLIAGGLSDEYFYLQDIKQRKLFLDTNVCQDSVSEIVKHIMRINQDDKYVVPSERKPIFLYITSNGGEIDSGFELIDAILSSNTPVYTINLGYQYSMAFLIGLAGAKRFAAQNAKYLMHDGSNFVFNSTTKAHDQMEFQRRVEERIKQYILSRSKISDEEYSSKLRVEWYLFADEAKEKGFVDYIIGTDCDLDEII